MGRRWRRRRRSVRRVVVFHHIVDVGRGDGRWQSRLLLARLGVYQAVSPRGVVGLFEELSGSRGFMHEPHGERDLLRFTFGRLVIERMGGVGVGIAPGLIFAVVVVWGVVVV